MDKNIWSATNALRVLAFLADSPGREWPGSEIIKATRISKAGVYLALRELARQGLVTKMQKGSWSLYTVNHRDAAVKQFKVLTTILRLKQLTAKLSVAAKKVILFGSAGRGENDADSDIDLFILAGDPAVAREVLRPFVPKYRLQTVVVTPTDESGLKEKDKVFYEEVRRGIVLWEKSE